MTVHNAKGLEFEVVAVPDLSRGLLSGGRRPVLALGREQPPRVGLQWRRLGRASVNLYDYGELIEEGEARDSEEGLRLFHVAATRARERLILSGVVKPEPAKVPKPGAAVIERIVNAFGLSREEESAIEVPAPEAREGLAEEVSVSSIPVKLNIPSPQRAAELRDLRLDAAAEREVGTRP